MSESFQFYLNKYLNMTTMDFPQVLNGKEQIRITQIPSDIMITLCQNLRYIFSLENTVIDIQSPIVVVGDLHGQLFDLLRIIQKSGSPKDTKYLFIGDIIDRGEFSLETITFIYLMKAIYPKNVFIIRGNHEFDLLCYKYGFYSEIVNQYKNGDEIYREFLNSFSFMPLAAVIDESNICVHGGIGPSISSIENIRNIQRPIMNYSNHLINSVLWSDPDESVPNFKPSRRGIGFAFGENLLSHFLDNSSAVRLIRGHEFVQSGFASHFGDKCLTVFSASNYCGALKNESTILSLKPSSKYEVIKFSPLPKYFRNEVSFIQELPQPPKVPCFKFNDKKTPFLWKNLQKMEPAQKKAQNANFLQNFIELSAKLAKSLSASSFTALYFS